MALLDNFTKEVYNMDGHAYCGGAIGFLIPYLETQFNFCKLFELINVYRFRN